MLGDQERDLFCASSGASPQGPCRLSFRLWWSHPYELREILGTTAALSISWAWEGREPATRGKA